MNNTTPIGSKVASFRTGRVGEVVNYHAGAYENRTAFVDVVRDTLTVRYSDGTTETGFAGDFARLRKVVEYTDRSVAPMAHTVTVDRGTRKAYAYGEGMMEVTRGEAARAIRIYRRRASRVAQTSGKGNTITIVAHTLPVGTLDVLAGTSTVRRAADVRTWMDIERGAVMAANVRAQAGTRSNADPEPARGVQ